MNIDIICFHKPGEPYDYLSNWYHSKFKVGDTVFDSVEQYMMFNKAMCFKDKNTARKILQTTDFRKIKQLGREVKNYNDVIWASKRYDVVKIGVYAKFSQSYELATRLLGTKNYILAECSAQDKIWGIGISMRDPRRFDITQWQGKNYLGKILMEVRDKLRSEV